MKKLLVLYKTHLDVGFTDLSEKVMELYLTRHIPHTVDTVLAVNGDGKKRYVWQTGSWLIDEYLKYAHGEDLARAEEAIRKGYISWHALPCTFHTAFPEGWMKNTASRPLRRKQQTFPE